MNAMLANYKTTITATLTAFAMVFPLAAQTSVTLDGTSGSNTLNTTRSTEGGLSLGLGFFAEYLIVGGGGGGGGGGYIDIVGSGGGGGGGEAGVVSAGSSSITSGSYNIVVGAGGSAGGGVGRRQWVEW